MARHLARRRGSDFTINSSVFVSVAIGTGNTLEALAAAILIRRFVGVPYRFQRGEDVIIFMAAAIVAAAIAAGIGLMPMALGSGLTLEELFTNVWTWWLGDVAGIIVFVPLILSWGGGDALVWPPRQKIEAVLFAVLLVVTAYLAFSGGARYAPPIPRSYLLVPFVLWVSFRFGQRETATAVATVCGIALWYTLAGRGPFATGALNSSLLLLLTYIIVLQGMGLVLCAVIGERSRAMAQVLEERDELESRVGCAPSSSSTSIACSTTTSSSAKRPSRDSKACSSRRPTRLSSSTATGASSWLIRRRRSSSAIGARS